MDKFQIRKMKADEVQIAIDWALKEGWNPGLNDAKCFYQADPEGFFIAFLNDEPIATGSAVVYDANFAFCGLYIVKETFRHRGFGMQLTKERLKYAGDRITGIDGVLENVSKYERIGYKSAYKNIRYACKPLSFAISSEIVDLKTVPFESLEKFDRRYFPASRSLFLKSWINQANSFALGFVTDDLHGYGVLRKCQVGYKIGPLFASSPQIAKSLFEGLCSQVKDGPIYLDMPEPNAPLFAKHYQMTPVFEVIRMYRNGFPDMDLQGVYGITTFELG